MFGFYRSRLREIPKVLWEAAGWQSRIFHIFLAAVSLLSFFAPNIAEVFSHPMIEAIADNNISIGLGLLGLLLIYGLLEANYDAYSKIEKRAEAAETSLKAAVSAGARLALRTGRGGSFEQVRDDSRLLRISVENIGSVPAYNVRVSMAKVEPVAQWIHPRPYGLHKMGDNEDPPTQKWTISVGEPPWFFDVASHSPQQAKGRIVFFATERGFWDRAADPQRYRCMVIATAENATQPAPPLEFDLFLDQEGKLQLEAVEAAT